MNVDLDKKDWRILYELDRNARQPDTRIADAVGLSRESVAYRINKLKDNGIIKNFVTILNHSAVNYLSFRVFFKFRDLTSDLEEQIVDFMRDRVAWMVRVRGGTWSFNTMMFADSVEPAERFMQELKQEFNDSFMRHQVSLITRIYHYRRGYLLDKDEDTTPYDLLGKNVERYELDETDRAILDTIQNNARMSSVDIGQEVGESSRVVRYRMNQLEDNGVILNYRSLLNLGKLGMSYFKVHADLKTFDEGTRERIRNYAHRHPHITYKTETVGGPDLELEIQAKNNTRFYEIWDAFVEQFQGVVADYRIMEYDKEYKLSYLNTLSPEED